MCRCLGAASGCCCCCYCLALLSPFLTPSTHPPPNRAFSRQLAALKAEAAAKQGAVEDLLAQRRGLQLRERALLSLLSAQSEQMSVLDSLGRMSLGQRTASGGSSGSGSNTGAAAAAAAAADAEGAAGGSGLGASGNGGLGAASGGIGAGLAALLGVDSDGDDLMALLDEAEAMLLDATAAGAVGAAVCDGGGGGGGGDGGGDEGEPAWVQRTLSEFLQRQREDRARRQVPFGDGSGGGGGGGSVGGTGPGAPPQQQNKQPAHAGDDAGGGCAAADGADTDADGERDGVPVATRAGFVRRYMRYVAAIAPLIRVVDGGGPESGGGGPESSGASGAGAGAGAGGSSAEAAASAAEAEVVALTDALHEDIKAYFWSSPDEVVALRGAHLLQPGAVADASIWRAISAASPLTPGEREATAVAIERHEAALAALAAEQRAAAARLRELMEAGGGGGGGLCLGERGEQAGGRWERKEEEEEEGRVFSARTRPALTRHGRGRAQTAHGRLLAPPAKRRRRHCHSPYTLQRAAACSSSPTRRSRCSAACAARTTSGRSSTAACTSARRRCSARASRRRASPVSACFFWGGGAPRSPPPAPGSPCARRPGGPACARVMTFAST